MLASDFGLRTSDFGLRTSDFGLRASRFALRTSQKVARVAYSSRSSSSVESLDSQLRVRQMVHRTVSDERLSLVALAWNLTPRAEGRSKGRSPYEMLGVDLANAERPWYDVLLDAVAA